MSLHKQVKALLLALVLFSMPCLPVQSWGEPVKLIYSDHDPLGGMRTQFLHDVWLPEIVRQTGGRIAISDYWGSDLLNSKEVVEGIRLGVAQMGFLFPGHYPDNFYSASIFKLFPRGPSRCEDMIALYRKAYAEIPEFKAELEKSNLKVLLFTAGLPGAFVGIYPFAHIEDIKGKRWRAGDNWALAYLKNAGAIPVPLPWDDVYLALQTSMLDGCFSNLDGMHLKKFDEVAPNILVSKKLWFAIPFIHVIGLESWNSLPKSVQDGITRASEIAEKKFAQVYDQAFAKIIAEQETAGYTVNIMTGKDELLWENPNQLKALQEQWVKDAIRGGLQTAPTVMEKMKALHKTFMEQNQ